VPATVLPNNLDIETKTFNCTPKEIYVEIIKMSSPSQNNILKGSMAQTQNKNQKNPTHEKHVPATVLPNNLDIETKTFNCTPKEIYVEIIKMSSPSQNNILKGSMAQTQNKNQKNPTHEKPVPATVLPNNLDTKIKTSDCTSV
jgi:stage V sporulation protein SpoVS